MIVYFARSIRGQHGEADQVLNRAIADAVRAAGHRLAMDTPVPEELRAVQVRDEYIYRRDLVWLDCSEVLVGEVTHASHGVGYEIAYARHAVKMPIFLLAEKDCHVSAMLTGAFEIAYYRDTADAQYQVREFLATALVKP